MFGNGVDGDDDDDFVWFIVIWSLVVTFMRRISRHVTRSAAMKQFSWRRSTSKLNLDQVS